MTKERIQLFAIALMWSNTLACDFAKGIGVSRGFVYDVLRGKKVSAKVDHEISKFILEQTRDLSNYLGN